jgi:hypothetical protein
VRYCLTVIPADTSPPSFQRKLESILISKGWQEAKVKMDPSLRWDDEPKSRRARPEVERTNWIRHSPG